MSWSLQAPALDLGRVTDDPSAFVEDIPGQGFALGGQLPAAGVVIGGKDDPGPLLHPGDGRADQRRLVGIHRPAGAAIAGLVIRMQGGIRQRINTGLADHQDAIVLTDRAEPKPFLAALACSR